MAIHGRGAMPGMAEDRPSAIQSVIGVAPPSSCARRGDGFPPKLLKRIGGGIGNCARRHFCETFIPAQCPRTQDCSTATPYGEIAPSYPMNATDQQGQRRGMNCWE